MAEKKPVAKVDGLLIISSGSGSITPEVDRKLRRAFPDHLVVDFDPKQDIRKLLTASAQVVVAGGDGTVGFVVRQLAGTRHALGVLSLGTFNNFAHGLGMPVGLDSAIEAIKHGRPHPITLGLINGRHFLEAAALGLFGETIALGEAAKDRAFGDFTKAVSAVAGSKPFDYELHGDIEGDGRARSLVFTNTPSIGTQLPVGDKTPVDPHLELSVRAGESAGDIVGRALASALLGKHRDTDTGMRIKFRRLEVTTKPRVHAYADNEQIGRSPVKIEADIGAVQVLLPVKR